MTEKIRIVLADDHPIVLDGLRNLIRAEPDFELVGEAASGLSALKIIREQRPDVAVLDISMPELNGIVLSRRLAGELPALRLLILTLHEDRAYLNQALEAGVRGYVLKMAALGFTNKEIASRLDVGVKSIETYKARGLEKLGLKTRAELVRYASGQGWLDF